MLWVINKKMSKARNVTKFLSGAILLVGASGAVADNGWYAGGQYWSIEDSGVDLGAAGIVVGNDIAENIAVEVMIGSGFGKDVEEGVKVELDRYYGLVLKPNMDLGDNANIFVNLGYVDIDIKATALGQSTSVSKQSLRFRLSILMRDYKSLSIRGGLRMTIAAWPLRRF